MLRRNLFPWLSELSYALSPCLSLVQHSENVSHFSFQSLVEMNSGALGKMPSARVYPWWLLLTTKTILGSCKPLKRKSKLSTLTGDSCERHKRE